MRSRCHFVYLIEKNFEHLIQEKKNFERLTKRDYDFLTNNLSIRDRIDDFECDSICDDHRIVIESSSDYFVILIRSDCFEYSNVDSDRSRDDESVRKM